MAETSSVVFGSTITEGISFSGSGAADQAVLECAIRDPSLVLTLSEPKMTFICSTNSSIFSRDKSYIATGISKRDVVELLADAEDAFCFWKARVFDSHLKRPYAKVRVTEELRMCSTKDLMPTFEA